jgi:chromosome partitioning protein
MQAKSLAIANRKGGCGKTSAATSLATELGSDGKRVLVIDCDEQCSISQRMLAAPLGKGQFTLYDVLFNNARIEDAIFQAAKQFPNCYIMPSSPKLKPADHAFNSALSRETLIKRVVDQARKNFDLIILDSPPAMSLITTAVLTASDYFLVPLGFDISSLEGVEPVITEAKKIESAKLGKPKYLGAFCTQYGQSRLLATKDFDKIAAEILGLLDKFHIPASSNWKQAEMRNTTLQTSRSHPISKGYQKLTKYITKEISL